MTQGKPMIDPQLTPTGAAGTTAEAVADALLSACATMLIIHSPEQPVPIKAARRLADALLDRIIERTITEGPKP